MEGTLNEDAGGTHRSCLKVLNKQGVCKEELMPYDVSKFKVAPSQEATRDALNYRISSYASVKNLTEIKKALAEKSLPVLLGMTVFESFEDENLFVNYVMPMPKKGEQNLGGHSVLCVGFDDSKKVLICRNSWGEDWCDEGYFYMPYSYVTPRYTFDYWMMMI
jgi:C1A family cysteine protease